MFNQFSNIFTHMVILFAAIGVGYLCKKINIMDEDFDRKLSKLVLNVTLPALILASVLTAEEIPDPSTIFIVMCLSVASMAVLIAVSFLVTFLLHIHDGHRGVFRFMMIFGNTGFLGFPVLLSIFGQKAVIYAVIYNLPFNFIVFTLGAWLIASDSSSGVKVHMHARDLINPSNIASLICIVLVFLGVHNVPVLGDAISTLGDFTTPATLLIVGSSLANLPVKQLFGGPKLITASLVRLLVTPCIILLLMQNFTDGLLLATLVVLAAMPVATNGTMLCYQYNGDAVSMAQGTFVTTLFSLVTIPLLVTVISLL